jgi:hypothetical protein
MLILGLVNKLAVQKPPQSVLELLVVTLARLTRERTCRKLLVHAVAQVINLLALAKMAGLTFMILFLAPSFIEIFALLQPVRDSTSSATFRPSAKKYSLSKRAVSSNVSMHVEL